MDYLCFIFMLRGEDWMGWGVVIILFEEFEVILIWNK